MFFYKIKTEHCGFTLLEMTIALGIFVILFTLTLGVYNYALKAEQRTIQVSKLQKEAQFITEIIAKKVRSGKINYSYYGSAFDPEDQNILALLDSGGNQTVFRFLNGSLQVCITNCQLESNFYAIPPTDVTVNSLKFFVNPVTNPFININEPPAEFPKVTVVLDLRNTRAGHTRDLIIQQTMPQRLAGF